MFCYKNTKRGQIPTHRHDFGLYDKWLMRHYSAVQYGIANTLQCKSQLARHGASEKVPKLIIVDYVKRRAHPSRNYKYKLD